MAARFVSIVVLVATLMGVVACSRATPSPAPTVAVRPDPKELIGTWRDDQGAGLRLNADGTFVAAETVGLLDSPNPGTFGKYRLEGDLFAVSDNVCEKEGIYRVVAFEAQAGGTALMQLRALNDTCQLDARRKVLARAFTRVSR